MFGIEFLIAYVLLGIIVGIAAGLLGIGGGGIIVPVLTTLFLAQGISSENVVHLALGTSMATIVVTSISSLRAHNKKKGVLWDVVKMMAPGVLIGTFLATFLASILSSLFLAIFFSIFMAYVSIQMFLNKKPKPSRTLFAPAIQFFSASVIGAISAMVSIGGGSLSVPYLLWQNVELKKAIGTSAAIGLPIAISGTLGYMINGWSHTNMDNLMLGYVSLPAFGIVAFFSFLTAPIGVKLVHILPVEIVKKVFACLLMFLSIKMLLTFM